MSSVSNQSLGQYLKEIRESKGLSIDEASRETNIAKRYIEALESDQYDFMPADMYTTGFLSAYADILELDRDSIIAMYNRAISKEQDTPLKELYSVNKDDSYIKKEYIYIGAGIIGSIFILFLGSLGLKSLSSYQSSQPARPSNKRQQIVFENLATDNSFSSSPRGTFTLQREGKNYTLQFQGVKNNNQISFRLGKNQYTQKPGDVLIADLTQDGINDIGMEIIDVDADTVRFSFTMQQVSADLAATTGALGFDITPYKQAILNETALAPIGNNATFNIKIRSLSAVWIQHKADGQPSVEVQMDPNEEISIRFIDGLTLLIGNAGAADISFAEYPGLSLKGGAVGESSFSVFYKKGEGDKVQLYRAQLK
ncbi:MAG: helix-turn-helix domain-containing protein [Brevinema sp.]